MKTAKENRNAGFHTVFKWNSTCFVICTKFAINLSQEAVFMKETILNRV